MRRRITILTVIILLLAVAGLSARKYQGRYPQLHGPNAVWLGDSYTAGGGVKHLRDGFAYRVSKAEHWSLTNLAEGGTGYVADRSAASFPDRRPLPAHVQQALAAQPRIVIVSGGYNDDSAGIDLSKIPEAADATLGGLRRGTDVPIVVVGPWSPDPVPSPALLRVRDVVQTTAHRYGLPFLDPIAEHWLNPSLIGPDRVHPTLAGHKVLTVRLLGDLRRQEITTGT